MFFMAPPPILSLCIPIYPNNKNNYGALQQTLYRLCECVESIYKFHHQTPPHITCGRKYTQFTGLLLQQVQSSLIKLRRTTGTSTLFLVEYEYAIEKWLNGIDADLSQFNSLAAHLTWKLSVDGDLKTTQQARQLAKVRNRWKNKVCQSKVRREWTTPEQRRKIFLLCRGAKFSDDSIWEYLEIAGRMAHEYNQPVCMVDKLENVNITEFPHWGECLYGEPDLEQLMKRTNVEPEELEWIWRNWHDTMGTRMKPLFALSVQFQNQAAINNGYNDIGEAWREELEIPDLEKVVFSLYEEIAPLYVLLHAVMRHKLYEKYGPTHIDPKGPIPVHLLGNMWGQDWSPLMNLFSFSDINISLDQKLFEKNLKVTDLVLEAEDFYTSLGLPKMTDKFWKYSLFEETDNTTLCHGTAANLYTESDFRMLMCGTTSLEDLYVIHHEMGHIEYYMAYARRSSFFQDGANTAIHESIGDAIMHGVMTPQHLHRLNLLTDEQLVHSQTELFLLFRQALAKIPEIPFALVIDKYRWDIFKGQVSYTDWNEYYWELNKKYRGVISPRDYNGGAFFDAGAKFHIPDNTPYVRYFLSHILQIQIFKSLCELALYGSVGNNGYLPLHRCDIYGSKNSGKRLMEMMGKGARINWSEALQIISGTPEISTKPFLEYYKPIYNWLENYVQSNDVYVGW